LTQNMTDLPKSQAPIYEIRLKGQLEPRWASVFDRMTITLDEQGDTLLRGPVVDQAALHGLLKRARDLGMPLLSVNLIEPEKKEAGQSSILSEDGT
jgi:hypothetical protein